MKNYLVIGASSGIGKRLTEILIERGDHVYGTYNQTEVPSPPAGSTYFSYSAPDEFDASALPEVIDGVAYCPGTINLKPFHRIKPEDFTSDYELQVGGAIRVLQAVMKNLKKSENPAVVLFSTVAVQTGFPFHSQVSASKGAIEGLTRALAAEWAPTIRVNAVAPSLTDTKLADKLLNNEAKREANAQRSPMKRIGTANDSAQMAAYLFSDHASWMTGQIIAVDGGTSALKV